MSVCTPGWTHNERGAEGLGGVPLGGCSFLRWEATVAWDAVQQRFTGRLTTAWYVG